MRLFAGSNATGPFPATNTPKVGVALPLICVVTVGAGPPMQAPVIGFVWHSERLTGKVAFPVLADAVICALAPTFTVATAKGSMSVELVSVTMPPGTAASATTSGTAPASAESSNVLRPGVLGAG